MKSITLRLPKDEYDAFDAICEERGYSKTGKIREYIRSMVREELERVVINKGSWKKIASAMGEIEKGQFVSFEDLKRGYAAEVVGHKKGRK